MPSGSIERVAKPSTADVAPPIEPLIAELAADVFALHAEAPASEEVSLKLERDGAAVELKIERLLIGDAETGQVGHLLVAVVPDPRPEEDVTLTIAAGAEDLRLGPAPLFSLCVDLRTFVRERLSALPVREREGVIKLLEHIAIAEGSPRDRLGFGASRAFAREGLREPLPPSKVERDEPQGLHFDSVVAISDSSFYLRGWARDNQSEITRLTAITPEGSRVELLPGIHREPRLDVNSFYEQSTGPNLDETGFLAYCETTSPSHLSSGWILEMENKLGVQREVVGPEVTRDLLGARASILSDLQKATDWETPLMDHVVPAVEAIQHQLEQRVKIEKVTQYGEAPTAPEVSIVVPLYGRVDFLEHQLAQFVHDPELREADLLYVLDSPELANALDAAAGELFELYGLPFRTVELSANGGYSVANNRGASLARGRLLLLLNSDVLPDTPGWLSTLSAFYGSEANIGALGPKLLFEDETIQHAGIRFQRPPGGGAWENEHFFKGLHRDLPAANETRRVPAVSGACLMITRELFKELGGLRGMYVQGDYEDTDLCLQLRQCGRETWYLPDVELYHLEGQSYAAETRNAMSRYNIWMHTRLWDEEIAATMAETQ